MARIQRLPFLALFLATACNERILHDLDEMRANQVMVVLSEAEISAGKEREGSHWSIAVSRSEVASALRAIEESRVLRRDLERSTEQSDSFLRSKEERAYTIERETAWGLERTLEQLPGVLEVRVHLSRTGKEHQIFEEESVHDSASVLVIAAPGRSPDETQIRKLVSGAAGVDTEKVIVLVTHSLAASEGASKAEALAPVVSAESPIPSHREFFRSLLGSAGLTKILAIAAGLLGGALILVWNLRREHERRKACSTIRIPPSAALRARSGSADFTHSSSVGQEEVF